MSTSTEHTRTPGLGLGGLLGLLFITLKLTGTIHWSWLWVLAPFWIPWAIVAALLVIAFLLTLTKALVER